MRIGWIILLPLLLVTVTAAENTEKLPDPFLDGVFIGDTSLDVEAALVRDGWDTKSEWVDLETTNPLYKVHGVQGNRTLIYQYDVYNRLTYMSYLEQWSSLAGCNKAFKVWYDWLKMYYGEPVEETPHLAHWSVLGYEVKLYDKTFISGESSMPTTMVNIFKIRIF